MWGTTWKIWFMSVILFFFTSRLSNAAKSNGTWEYCWAASFATVTFFNPTIHPNVYASSSFMETGDLKIEIRVGLCHVFAWYHVS